MEGGGEEGWGAEEGRGEGPGLEGECPAHQAELVWREKTCNPVQSLPPPPPHGAHAILAHL